MTAPVFFSLMLQSILNPNIVTLWETILSGQVSELKETVPRHLCPIGVSDEVHVPTTQKKQYQNQEQSLHQEKSSVLPKEMNSIPILGRIICPTVYDGVSYGVLFEDFLERSGVLCIGVHRFTEKSCTAGQSGGHGGVRKGSSSSSNELRSVEEELRGLSSPDGSDSIDKDSPLKMESIMANTTTDDTRCQQHIQGSQSATYNSSNLQIKRGAEPPLLASEGEDDSDIHAAVDMDSGSGSDSDSDFVSGSGDRSNHEKIPRKATDNLNSAPNVYEKEGSGIHSPMPCDSSTPKERKDTSISSDSNVSMPYVFIAPSSIFILKKSDFIFVLRGP